MTQLCTQALVQRPVGVGDIQITKMSRDALMLYSLITTQLQALAKILANKYQAPAKILENKYQAPAVPPYHGMTPRSKEKL